MGLLTRRLELSHISKWESVMQRHIHLPRQALMLLEGQNIDYIGVCRPPDRSSGQNESLLVTFYSNKGDAEKVLENGQEFNPLMISSPQNDYPELTNALKKIEGIDFAGVVVKDGKKYRMATICRDSSIVKWLQKEPMELVAREE